MQTVTISATKARNQFFDILTWVGMGNSALIKKDNVDIVKMIPVTQPSNLAELKKLLKSTKGIFPDWDVMDSPLRGRKAKNWLKKASDW